MDRLLRSRLLEPQRPVEGKSVGGGVDGDGLAGMLPLEIPEQLRSHSHPLIISVHEEKAYVILRRTESKFPDEDYDAQVQASCAGQGMATNYKFKGGSFWAETYPGSDSLYIVTLCDDTVTTAEGIYIGSTMDKVKEVYGEPSTATDTLLVYEKGSSELRFNFDANGAVNGIFYIGKF